MSEDIQQQISKLNQQVEKLYQQGRYEEAIQSASQVRDLSFQYPGEDHRDFATSLNNLALLYSSMGNYTQAEPLYRQAMEIWRKALGEDHSDFATSLNNLAELYRSMGNYTQAEPLYRQAMEIKRKALGEDHPDFATSLNDLALFYYLMGNYTQAEPLHRQAVEIWRKALGEDHPYFATSLNSLAGLCIATDRETEALTLMEQAASIDDLMIGQVFSIGSESQRTAYLKKVRKKLEGFISLVSQHLSSSQAAINSALELVLRRKAIGAEALAAQRDAVLGGRYPELEPELRDLINLRMEIAQKTLAGPGQEGLAEHQKTLSIRNKQKENLEAELARQIPEMNLEQKLKQVDRQAIASILPEGAALIEFVRFDVLDFKAVPAKGESKWKPARYLAFVILAGEPDNVQMIDLGEARFTDKRIARFRDSITGWPEETKRDLGAVPEESVQVPGNEDGVKLREAIFDKLKPALSKCKHLFISPDGELSRVPFEVLPNETGRFLIDDYHISYLGAGRDILRFGTESKGQSAGSLVIADPDFDLGLKKSWRLPQRGKLYGRQSCDLDRSNLHFGHLPGTQKEGNSVSNMLGVRPWLRGNALEARIKEYRSPRILHFATHGFFLKDQERDPNKEIRDPGGMGRLSGLDLENPLLRSGLALAGVNTWLKGQSPPSDAEDGLLTAEDVTGLDLLDTELVVLQPVKPAWEKSA